MLGFGWKNGVYLLKIYMTLNNFTDENDKILVKYPLFAQF